MATTCRFYYNNVITDATTITPTSQKTGFGTIAYKDGTSSVTLSVAGSYTGYIDRTYTVEIEASGSTFRWKDDDASTVWNASGVAITTSNISLSYGISIRFSSTSPNATDKWIFRGLNNFGVESLIDWERDTSWRSDDGDVTTVFLTIDLGRPQRFNTVIIADTNLTSSAQLLLSMDTDIAFPTPVQIFMDAPTWGVYPKEDVPPGSGLYPSATLYPTKALHNEGILWDLGATYTYRYIQLVLHDPSNADNYLEVGNLFVGEYFQPGKNFALKHNRNINAVFSKTTNTFGKNQYSLHNRKQSFSCNFPMVAETQYEKFELLFHHIENRNTQILQPFYFQEDGSQTTVIDADDAFWMMETEGGLRDSVPGAFDTNGAVIRYHNLQISMLEVAKTKD